MKKAINKTTFIQILLTVLIFYTILFPADKLNIKEILLFITLFLGYFGRKIKMSFFIVFFGIVFPLMCIGYSLIRGCELSNVISFGYVWFFLLLIPLIKEYEFNFKKVFIVATYVVALIIDFIMIVDVLNIYSIFENPLSIFFVNMNELQGLGKGILATFGYSIFYKSCPLIIISYAYFLYEKKFLKLVPLFISMFACGTRANFLITLLITALVPIICFKTEKKKYFIVIVLTILGFYYLPIFYDKIMNLNSLKYNGSELVKMADTEITMSILRDNTVNLLFGTGIGSTFFSSRGHYMLTFEYSFIDYLRQTGIFGLSILIIFVTYIIRILFLRKNKWLIIALVCYLAIAATNPLLVTSTSFMAFLLAIVYKEEICYINEGSDKHE